MTPEQAAAAAVVATATTRDIMVNFTEEPNGCRGYNVIGHLRAVAFAPDGQWHLVCDQCHGHVLHAFADRAVGQAIWTGDTGKMVTALIRHYLTDHADFQCVRLGLTTWETVAADVAEAKARRDSKAAVASAPKAVKS